MQPGTIGLRSAPCRRLPAFYSHAFGSANAAALALAQMYNQLIAQATTQGYQDVYMELSYASIILVFLAFLLSKNKPGEGAGGGGMH